MTSLLHQRSVTGLEWQFDPPAEVLQSRLFAAGGYLVVRGLFDEETLQGLREEAERVRIEAERMVVTDSDGAEGRGGSPARAYRSGAGGELHWGLHGCQQMAETLARVCGLGVSASGSGTYSYYEQAGDSLAIHQDVLSAISPSSRRTPAARWIAQQAGWCLSTSFANRPSSCGEAGTSVPGC